MPFIETRYRFRVHQPIERDVTEIVLIRYTIERDFDFLLNEYREYTVKSEILTRDAWREFKPGEVLPLGLVPSIDGIDTWRRNDLVTVLDEFEQHIRKMIHAETGAQANGFDRT